MKSFRCKLCTQYFVFFWRATLFWFLKTTRLIRLHHDNATWSITFRVTLMENIRFNVQLKLCRLYIYIPKFCQGFISLYMLYCSLGCRMTTAAQLVQHILHLKPFFLNEHFKWTWKKMFAHSELITHFRGCLDKHIHQNYPILVLLLW